MRQGGKEKIFMDVSWEGEGIQEAMVRVEEAVGEEKIQRDGSE